MEKKVPGFKENIMRSDIMTKEVFIVNNENKSKAETLLRGDDLISRQSITIRLATALGMKEDGYFILIDGSDESIKKAEELLKGTAERYKNKNAVIDKIKEEEDSAIEGFGNIVGF